MKLHSDDEDVEMSLGGEDELVMGALEEEDVDLPTSIIFTNVDIQVFNDVEAKTKFEALVKEFEEEAAFQYFKSFRRVKVNFSTSVIAAQARIQLHQTQVGENLVNCYFAQPIRLKDNADPYLQLPAPVKQFLISPPASPPVGWEPVGEAEPVINYDLLSAMASLAPGESHELHPPSANQPGIVVHVCHTEAEEDNTDEELLGACSKPKFAPTRCPERNET
ncbi:hypothetical protein CHUAL_006574 [Chamberlinius hualienensis]